MTTNRQAPSAKTRRLAVLPNAECEPGTEQYKQIQGKPVRIAMRLSIRLLLLQVVTLLLGVGLYLSPAAAQTVNGSLGGLVSDATGARVAGATVTLVNEASLDTRKTKTNGEGVYQFSSVPPGVFTLKVQHSGFSVYTESGIELHPNDSRTLPPVSMRVGSVDESVTVTADNDIITTSERSSLITAEDVKKLSTVGRDVSELLKTQPGFTVLQNGLDNGLGSSPEVVGQGSGLGNYVGNGAPGNGATVTSDGANVTDPGNGSGQTQTVNMDMVSELKIETSNFGADTAKGPTVITAVGKSGGSDFHGTVYGFGRTSQLNTQDWFMKNQQLGQIPDRYIYPGFGIGGPILIPGTKFNQSKKLVFYAGGEDYVQRNVYSYGSPLKSFINALVPTDKSTNSGGEAGMRQGNFSQAELASYLGVTSGNYSSPSAYVQGECTPSGALSTYLHVCSEPNTLNGSVGTVAGVGGQFKNGAASFDPGAAALLNAEFPLPTGPTVNGYNWRALNLENPSLFQIRGKVDYAVNDNNKISGVYNTEYGHTSGIPEQIYYSPSAGGSQMGGLDTPGKIISTQTSNTASFTYTRILSSRSTNDLNASLSYVANYYVAGNSNALLASTIGYNYKGIYANATKEFPQLGDYGVHGLPLAITPDFSNGRYISKKFLPAAGDNFVVLLGAHTLKFGGYAERDTANQTDLSPITNGQITNYYVPGTSVTDSDGTVHDTANCGFNNCGNNYLADFMLGDVDQFFQQNFNPQTNIYFWTISGFVQDSWKVNSKLTLELGLRADHLGAWTDSHGLGIATFSPALYAKDAANLAPNTTTVALPGVRWHGNASTLASNADSSLPLSGDKTRLAFISPRFGLAYDMYGNGSTVLRGGWGMYRNHDSWNDFSPAASTAQGLLISSVGGSGTSLRNIGLVTPGFQCNASTTAGCPSISALDPTDDEQPLTMTYSFTLSQRAPFGSALEIAYVGNQSQDLLSDSVATTIQGDIQNVNAVPMGAMFKADPNTASMACGTATTPTSCFGQVLNPDSTSAAQQNDYRPFPYYTNVLVPKHIVWANYNALQTTWNRQKGHLNYGLNYTWSKALGVRGGYNNGLTTDPTNFRADYGPLAFDRTHVANASYSYDEGNQIHKGRLLNALANQWFLSGITNLQSGPNLQAIYSPNLDLTGTVGPSVNGNALNIDSKSLLGSPDILLMPRLTCNPGANLQKNQYVNGKCFALEPAGINGPTNMGYLRAPKFLSSDLTLQKRIPFADKRNVELRASAFNFLNHPITGFSSRYKNEASLQMFGNNGYQSASLLNGTNTNPGGPSCSAWGTTCFGYAGYKTGRRVMEVSARFNF